MKVNPALWEAKVGGQEPTDHPGQHSETSSLQQIKTAGRGGTPVVPGLLRRLRWEDHLSSGGQDFSEL